MNAILILTAIKEKVFEFKDWSLKRLSERTSWDGGVIIAVCGTYLALGQLVDIVAWAGLAYGAWTLWKSETSK